MRGPYSYKIDYSSDFDASPLLRKHMYIKDIRAQAVW